MLITVILEFTIYFIKQHREHKKFDYLKLYWVRSTVTIINNLFVKNLIIYKRFKLIFVCYINDEE
jgi:hypothetical protein